MVDTLSDQTTEQRNPIIEPYIKVAQKTRSAGAWGRIFEKIPQGSKDPLADLLKLTLEENAIRLDERSIIQLANEYDEIRQQAGFGQDPSIDHEKLIKFFLQHKGTLPQNRTRRHFLRAAGLGGAGLALAGLGLGATAATSSRPEPTRSPTTSPKAENTPAQVALPTKAASPTAEPTPEKPINFMNEALKPFINEAMRKREIRKASDPEYAKRVDLQLNEGRINFVLAGYGVTLEEPFPPTRIGSQTILSYNMKTQSFDVISLTHDIRAPEIERNDQKKGQVSKPTKIDQAYNSGKFPLMREVIEDATGLCVDFQVKLDDPAIKDLVDNVLGGLEIDLPFDLKTRDFFINNERQDKSKFPPFKKGPQTLSGTDTIRFLKAMADEPYDPSKERNVRKHLVFNALIGRVVKDISNPLFLTRALMFYKRAEDNGTLDIEADFGELVKNNLGNLLNLAGQKLFRKTEGATSLKTGKTLYIVDPGSGGGGVNWVGAAKEDNQNIREEFEANVYEKDTSLAIPQGGNPKSQDLVAEYWGSLRRYIKQQLQS
ncbi:LCP family protein [Candidatus Daviesbacteria bacterium]|nr:LCP family protein [Candidatus Daviesbacteria bacterium]